MKHLRKVGIVCCSNGQKIEYKSQIDMLKSTMLDMGLQPVFSDYIYERDGVFSGSAQERAYALMEFYKDDEIKEIFDISGGDIANGVLPYLDYEVIAHSSKRFWGYSDLTTIVNAIYAKTGKEAVLYQIKNLVWDDSKQQVTNFKNTVIDGGTALFSPSYGFIQGDNMQGVVVGGNIRCLLKLAGTEYMPDLSDKILLLESLGGTVPQLETHLCQLQQMGAFDKVAGVLLGTFTAMEQGGCVPTIETLVKKVAGDKLPIAITREIGHGTDSKGLVIGREMSIKKII